jgi:NDP-sugar pyrophosphorylase family protein
MLQIVVPMAGSGRRFADAGYKLPKPLLPVAGVPMVVQAVRDLPPAGKIVFVCHPDHVAQHQIDRVLAGYFPQSQVVLTPGLTEGQACSVRLAAPSLDMNEPVLVAACDNSHFYDRRQFETLTRESGLDAVIWTYRRDPRVLVRPEWYGWVRTTAAGEVLSVSCKRPISENPIADHVISGCFWFRSAGLMIDGIDALVAANQRVNNEFYLDSVPNVLISQGRRVKVFEVQKYVGWGTPDDFEDFRRWQQYFTRLQAA